MRGQPENEMEIMLQKTLQQADTPFYGDMWPLMERDGSYNLIHILAALEEGVRAGILNPRILKQLAVLDITTDTPAFQTTDLRGQRDMPWGRNGILNGTPTLIYHITSGYARQHATDLVGDPKDDFSVSFFQPGDKKWL